MNGGFSLSSLMSIFNGQNKGTGYLAPDLAKSLLDSNKTDKNNEHMLEHPKIKEIMQNPLEAYEKNEALRNLLSKHDPSLNLLFHQKEKGNQTEYEPSTDLGAITLQEKIQISPLNGKTSIVKVLLIGRSGCGQTSLLGYLTENKQFKGADTMFAQDFEANAFDITIGEVGFEIRLTESPGMCGGIELDELGCHWKELIKTTNGTGGVGIFMLLIKSNERILSEFFEEFQAFSAQYVEDTDLFWRRTIVIFTSIDELKNCDTYEASVERLQRQINGRGMEKLKGIIDQTQGDPLFVSSMRVEQREQFKHNLSNAISMIVETQNKDGKQESYNDIENKEIAPSHDIKSKVSLNETEDQIIHPKPESISNEILPEMTPKEIEKGKSNSDLSFLEDLSRNQLLDLIKDMCKDESCSRKCKEIHKRRFDDDGRKEPEPKRKKNKFLSLFRK